MQNNQHAKKSKKVYLQLLGSVLNGRHFLSNTPQLICVQEECVMQGWIGHA